MASRVCWICGRLTHMTMYGEARYVERGISVYYTNFGSIWAAFTCDNCSAMSIATCPRKPQMGQPRQEELVQAFEVDANHTIWLPAKPHGKDFPDVPEPIALAASEAHKCASVSTFRGAMMLARAVIEATAKAKGITKGLLNNKIEALENQSFIRSHVREAADEIRHIGNDMAHGDFEEEVTEDDATDILVLMDEILLEVFQSPARTAKIKEARLAKNAKPE